VREVSPEVRRLAEEPETVFPPAPRRLHTAAYTIGFAPSPTQSVVSGVRTTARELDRVIAEIRGELRAAVYTRTVWTVGPSSRPEGLSEALVERGFFPATEPPFEPELTAMTLLEPPPPPGGVEARVVRDFDEYLASMRLAVAAMGGDETEEGGWIGSARELWDQPDGIAKLTHVAYVDGKMAGFGWAVAASGGLMMNGSGVRPEWRGRGAYRALVAARWATAVALGTPALAIQAGAMSRPILERCGFQPLCRIDVLQDPEVKPRGEAPEAKPPA
jgi:GNAT superfamily N-acetyltransferase